MQRPLWQSMPIIANSVCRKYVFKISIRLLTSTYFHEVYYNDIPVGTVCARLEKGAKEGEHRLYIMTMGILAVRRLASTAPLLL